MFVCVYAFLRYAFAQEAGVAGFQVPNDVLARTVFSKHGKMWARQTIRAQREFMSHAKLHHAARAAEIRQEYDFLLAQMDILTARAEEERDFLPPMCMSVSALTEKDLEQFQELVERPSFRSPARLKKVRTDVAFAPPVEPNLPLREGQVVWQRQEAVMPGWARDLIRHRDFFDECALVTTDETGQQSFFKIVYCVQSPGYMAVCKLVPTQVPPSDLPTGASAMQLHMAYRRHYFKCNFADMMSAADMPAATHRSLQVLWGLNHEGGVLLSSQFDPEPLHPYLVGKEQRASAQPKDKQEKDELYERMVIDMPWLQHLDMLEGFEKSVRAAEKTAAASSKKVPDDVFEVDEEVLLSALTKLEKAKAAEADHAKTHGHVDFYCKECYGDSTLVATRGSIYHDAVQGHCIGQAADSWARTHNLQVTFKCTFTEHEEVPSRVITRAWVDRMQFFFNMAMSSDVEPFVYTEEQKDSYLEPDELTRLVPTLTKGSTLKRVAILRRIPFRY